ncbi:MAG: MarR family transcriptional regulator [Spirochaetales bacterium]|nr:MarR family transcriptional regulator [Spirochaetales bacterium]
MVKKIIGRDISILYRHKIMSTEIELKQFNLNKAQAETLLYLKRNPGVNLKQINDYFMLNKATITKIINHLDKTGYVNRVSNNNDKRTIEIYLTTKGEDVIPKLIDVFETWESRLLKNMALDDIEKLRELLSQMVSNITHNKELE